MKIIDAINKINKEEKFRFRLLCDGDIYKYIGGSLYNETVGERAEWIIDNKWLNEEIEIIEEEKKTPEKLKEFGIKYNLGHIDYKNIETLKYWLNKDFQTIYDTLDLLIKNQNKLIDYLKSKGE